MTYGYLRLTFQRAGHALTLPGLRRAALQAFSGTDIRFLRRTPSSFRRSTMPLLRTDGFRYSLPILRNMENKIQPINQILKL